MSVDSRADDGVAVAIVGIGCWFAASHSPDRLWSILVAGRDVTSEVPAGRWLLDPAEALDTRIALADHVYTTRGGFVEDPPSDFAGSRLDPERFRGLDPVFHLAWSAASQAWQDAQTEPIDRRRAGVVFGNIVLPTETASALSRESLGRALTDALENVVGGDEGTGFPRSGVGRPSVRTGPGSRSPSHRLRAGSGPFVSPPGANAPFNAFPAGLPAAVVAEALGLGGGAYTLDAACASSLYALKLAVDELRSGRADAMIAGGVSRPDSLYTQMGFSQLRALSPRGKAAPLDRRADGLIVGEGAGMFVVKRLDDAVRHGDHIYGIVAGIGLSNDVHGDLLAPDSEGQLRAMRQAYERAGWSPLDVDLIECHATGTPRGDAVEIQSLRALWGQRGWPRGSCVIGSVKGNIGHTLTAAGAAGLLKVLLALKHGVFPPTANFERPASVPAPGWEEGPFRILDRAEPWPRRSPDRPRRAAISGFGFGGINAHVLIEEWSGSHARPAAVPVPVRARSRADVPIAIVGLGAQVGPLAGPEAFQALVFGGGPEAAGPAPRLSSLEFRLDEFRIPPRELAEMLPQQSLMLRVATAAIRDSGWEKRRAARTGVLVGIGLDLNTTNYHLRWSLPDRARAWDQSLGLDFSPEVLAGWTDALKSAAGPALTANRTMGSLGGLVASRIAREFRIGGPSFTVSCDETSGNQALAIAVDWLRCGELDAVIVGAVDLAGDPRSVQARRRLGLEVSGEPSDAAVALVLERLEDARGDGDRVYAVIRGIDTSRRGGLVEGPAPDMGRKVGEAGATTGLASVVKGVLCLHHRILLPETECLASASGRERNVPQFWLRNRADGPRRIEVRAASLGGHACAVDLEEASSPKDAEKSPSSPDPRSLAFRRHGLFALEADDDHGLAERAQELARFAREVPDAPIDVLARSWWRRHPNDPRLRRGVAIAADGVASLERDLERLARDPLAAAGETLTPVPRRMAFVYPGLGNHFAGMGRELSILWPGILRRGEVENQYLRDQLAPEVWWDGSPPARFADHRVPILGQVSIGSLVTDVLRSLGVAPDAAIGYSMGESAALVSLGAWRDRDALFVRLRSSPLFESELAGPCLAARRVWGIQPEDPVEWVAGIVPRSAEAVRATIDRLRSERVYVLIKNTPEETVIGGFRPAVGDVVRDLRCSLVELPTVGTVHCEVGRAVASQYRALHDIETLAPAGITFYSGVTGRPYACDRNSAADAITDQATQTIDFPAVIERAYSDGVGVFIEVGPGMSCTRLIGRILGTRPHVACSACRPDRDALATVLEVLSHCIAHRLPVDLGGLYDGHEDPDPGESRLGGTGARTIRVDVGLRPFHVPPLPARPQIPAAEARLPMPHAFDPPASLVTSPSSEGPIGIRNLSRALHDAEQARLRAHRAYLRVAEGVADLIGKHVSFQLGLLEDGKLSRATGSPQALDRPAPEAVLFDREQCLELAVGSVAAVFGPEFAEVDRLPVRVRLPDEPLMLVDRIVSIEGTPRSLDSGRIVTEHVIQPGAWYLDQERIAPCIAMEAGQADLVLSGYLGVDFETQGLALYRLLDATVTFHGGLAGVGTVIRYDIRITRFFRQGRTILFRFEFDATAAGAPILTMRDGCAGFFTVEELASGQGIVAPRVPLPSQRSRQSDLGELISSSPACLDHRQVEALRRGDLATAFGTPFDRLPWADPIGLPGGRMALIHRVETLDPSGGPAGLGWIRSKMDIHPGEWFMACHFIDDRVMPGTLMYECCLHTLRVLMMRLGWIGRRGEVAFEPVPGVANRLRCRGQITESTREVAFEVTIKERGYRPEPYTIADALIVADGKPIVAVTDLALQLSGTNRYELERLWAGCGSVL